MNKCYGGKQSRMRNTKIMNESYLGQFTHPQKLKVGQTQSMTFQEGNSGPFYLSEEEKIKRKYDIETDKEKEIIHTRACLIDKIKQKTGMQKVRGNLKEVQKIATNLDIPIKATTKKILEGWAGKPKGMMQVLWERGFLNPEKSSKELMKCFSKGFKKDKETKEDIPGTSLMELINNLPDFKTELTLLQFWASQLGVTVECSPKFHPEIAGEGVEFCWALGKNTYRTHSVEEKRTKSKYLQLVKECTCSDTVITKQEVRKFGRRTCRYMLAYYALEQAKASKDVADQQQDNDGIDLDIINLPEMSSALVEKIIKVYKKPHKAHHNILDSEKSFLRAAAKIMRAQK